MSQRSNNEYEEELEEVAQATVGNQNTLMFVVAALVFLLVIVGGLFLKDGGLNEDPEVARLKQEIRDRESRLGLQSGTGGESSQEIATRIQRDSVTLANLSGTLEARLIGVESELATIQQSNRSLTDTIARLQTELNNAQSGAVNAETMQLQLKALEDKLAVANQQLAAFRDKPDLTGALSAVEAERDLLKKQIDLLKAEIDQLKEQIASTEDVSALRKANRELRIELQRLRAELDRASLYVESETDLAAPAKRLFTRLKELEGVTPDRLQQEYDRIRNELNATVVDKITFATGKSSINFEKEENIRQAVNEASEDAFILVVGYASTTGGIDVNREISANRATTSASVANFNRQPQQQVQAVFLGQTNRFSVNNPAENQICEIWELKK